MELRDVLEQLRAPVLLSLAKRAGATLSGRRKQEVIHSLERFFA